MSAEASNIYSNLDMCELDAAERALAECMGKILQSHYPKPKTIQFWWAVHINSLSGIVTIYNLALSGDHAFVLHLDKLTTPNDVRKLTMMAGGEMLERYDLPRNTKLINDDRIRTLKRDSDLNFRHFA